MTTNAGKPTPPEDSWNDIDEVRQTAEHRRLKTQLHQQLIANMNLAAINTVDPETLRIEVRRVLEELCNRSSILLNRAVRERLVTEVMDETFGLGPLEPLLADPTISDILINGYNVVYVERNGRLEKANVAFNDERHLVNTVQRIVGRMGRRVDETSPMVDGRLPDGSRINAIIPPLALDGALVSIRRFGVRPILADDLVRLGAMTQEMKRFLAACVEARLNVLISGGTGSGKTTLLNALSAYIPAEERVITIEDAAELRLQQPHVGRLETRPNNAEGAGEVTTRDLVKNALRMRPDRIVIGECRGAETLDMLQAMNTGHAGSLTTVHANDTREALGRLEVMVGMTGLEIPIWVIRRQIASAIHLIIQVSRLQGGARKVIKVTEVVGMEGDNLTTHDLFLFRQTGLDGERRARGISTPPAFGRITSNGWPPPVSTCRSRGSSGASSAPRACRRWDVELLQMLIFFAVSLGVAAGGLVWVEIAPRPDAGGEAPQPGSNQIRAGAADRAPVQGAGRFQPGRDGPAHGNPSRPVAASAARRPSPAASRRRRPAPPADGPLAGAAPGLARPRGLPHPAGWVPRRRRHCRRFAVRRRMAGPGCAAGGRRLPGRRGRAWLYLRMRLNARREAVLRQLPAAFDLMARILRSGLSMPQAFQGVAEAFPNPLAAEFARCRDEQNLGILPEISFRGMAERIGVLEMKIFVMAMLIQRLTGGNLSEVLERLAELIRERLRLRSQVRTLTAEGRMQAGVLLVLPVVMFFAMRWVNRPYTDVLLAHPDWLTGMGVLMAIGALWIRKIIDIE